MEDKIPTTLEECFELLTEFFKHDISAINEMSENKFMSSTHFSSGMFIRNNWFLWWYPNHNSDKWPKEQPKLNQYFNSIGITHADDMSGIILTSFYRHLKGENLKLNEQIKIYHKHWIKCGYPDGIPKQQ